MLGKKIKMLREAKGINQPIFAKSVGVTKQCVSNWENENIQPSIDMLVKIARYFAVSTDYLLDMDDRKYIEITGLTDKQLANVRAIINDILYQNEG